MDIFSRTVWDEEGLERDFRSIDRLIGDCKIKLPLTDARTLDCSVNVPTYHVTGVQAFVRFYSLEWESLVCSIFPVNFIN